MQVDVVVNYTSCDLQLNQGAVSKSLLQAGGQGIDTECQQNAPDGIKFGQVVVTSGGNLKCRIIVHGACCKWNGGAGKSEKVGPRYQPPVQISNELSLWCEWHVCLKWCVQFYVANYIV